jgi:S1-C subfamily serine protease
MFRTATAQIREALYGIIARSSLGATTNHCLGSGVMVAPGFVVTNAHILHLDGDVGNGGHRTFEVIRSPDIGKNAVSATLVREDTVRDLAMLKIEGGSSGQCVFLAQDVVASGVSCGSLGFPLSVVASENGRVSYGFTERFQGAFISAYITERVLDRLISWYEVDRVMYGGSSGCPFFTQDGKVVGLQARVRNSEKNVNSSQNFLAISLLIPSPEVLAFIKSCGVT